MAMHISMQLCVSTDKYLLDHCFRSSESEIDYSMQEYEGLQKLMTLVRTMKLSGGIPHDKCKY